jgi:FkbM family methyltransferase
MLRRFVEYERELRHSFDLQILDTQGGTAGKRMWLVSLYLQARTLILRNAIRRNVWIADGLNVLMSLAIEPGDIVFDIGANVGWITERAAWLVGKNGRVHSFEPSPTTCKNLRRRLTCMGLSNVIVNEFALGGGPGIVTLYEYAENYGGSSSLRTGAAPGQHLVAETSVAMKTLDDYVEQNSIPNVRLVKMDIQGSEIDVLHGARRFLTAPNRPVLYIEVERVASEAFGYGVNDLLNSIMDMGYTLYAWRDNGLINIRSQADIPVSGHDDVICLVTGYHDILRIQLEKLAMRSLLKIPSQL